MNVLDHIKDYQKFFEELTRIPHGSGNEKAISDHLVAFAKAHGLRSVQDQVNNVIIYKDATSGYEDKDAVILQAHIDMVNEKNADVEHDFEKDPLKLEIVDGYLRAKGTTLGGDDGAGVAMIMAVLADQTLAHPAIEALFTVDEESTMIGAFSLDPSLLRGTRLINIDAEEEDTTNTCSAGGEDVFLQKQVRFEQNTKPAYLLEVKGLLGGHSGAEIHKGRGNANKVLGRLLHAANEAKGIRLANWQGGLKINAIPREAQAVFAAAEEVKDVILDEANKIRKELEFTDPGFTWELKEATAEKVMEQADSDAAIRLLYVLPCGMRQFSEKIGVTQASENTGIISVADDTVRIETSTRGALDSYVKDMKSELLTIAAAFGFNGSGDNWYPAWDYMEVSPLRDTMAEVYAQMHGSPLKMEAIHGGLECGIFKEKMPALDIVTMGPNLYDVHTPDEKLDLASFDRTYAFLCRLIAAL